MSQHISGCKTKLDKTMNTEQFEQVVEAILAGKYSWACVLILRFAGYNPLHYIPYRTYNRLLKENCQFSRNSRPRTESIQSHHQGSETTRGLSNIKDLPYLEVVSNQQSHIKGGNFEYCLDRERQKDKQEKHVVLPIKKRCLSVVD